MSDVDIPATAVHAVPAVAQKDLGKKPTVRKAVKKPAAGKKTVVTRAETRAKKAAEQAAAAAIAKAAADAKRLQDLAALLRAEGLTSIPSSPIQIFRRELQAFNRETGSGPRRTCGGACAGAQRRWFEKWGPYLPERR